MTARSACYDLESGDSKFEGAIPKEGIFNADCKGLAFSPDGKELAGLYMAFSKGRYLCWNADGGEVSADLVLEEKTGPGRSSATRGPASSGWPTAPAGSSSAARSSIASRAGASGRSPSMIPSSRSSRNARSTPGACWSSRARRSGGPAAPVSLSKDQLAKAAEAVKSGGDASDALLPPLTAADRSRARKVAADGSGGTPGAPDPGPAIKAGIGSRPIPLKSPAGEVQRISFAAPDAGLVAVASGPGGNSPFNDAERDTRPRHVDVFDLAAGRPLGRVDVPGVQAFAAISPEGSRLLFQGAKDQRRLDVYSLKDGGHLAGWQPFDNQAGDLRSVSWAAFLDADKVLTMNKSGTLALLGPARMPGDLDHRRRPRTGRPP